MTPSTHTEKRPDHHLRLAPPIVGDVIRDGGAPLPVEFSNLAGHDFGAVRVHTDRRAGLSALAIGAEAYSVGAHIVFAPQRYAPNQSGGGALLMHELAHVRNHNRTTPSNQLMVANTDDRFAPGTPAAERHGVVHRSVLGGILGSIGGAAVGALGGALLGGLLGPVGAIVGGIVGGLAGAAGGAALADAASTRSRALSSDEITYATEVFGDSLDYARIRITRDSVFAVGAPRTLGNTINLKSDWGHFVDDTLELTQTGRETLIHEICHAWQYQNGGLAYIPESLIAQLKAAVGGKSRNAAYDWREARQQGLPWEEWNPEQQAEAIEDYNKLLRKSKTPGFTPNENHVLAMLLPYVEKVRHREGAPNMTPQLTSDDYRRAF